MSIVVKLKPLYMIASASNGYSAIHYTFDKNVAENAIENDPEEFGGMDSGPDCIMVPEAMTYADLGITYSLEDDLED